MRSALVLVLASLALAGCGGGERSHGTATLWVTRDRGAQVVFAGAVPAGLDGIQAVEQKLKVTTSYGGRFLQSIDGISGSLSAQRDWFFFVNGVEGDRSATEVTLHAGDVLWWDYRRWDAATMSIPVVVGSYPEPFIHGFPGKTSVVASDRTLAAQIAAQVHGVVDSPQAARNSIVIGGNLPPQTARIERVGNGARLELGLAAARRLARDPHALRFRF
ncbi:MAG TPA: DUF4430 domain-containing protein [Gaiellaceae bacterium]|nr:DUF4430 domain-containing protein [Gaiellaceae bacterium]